MKKSTILFVGAISVSILLNSCGVIFGGSRYQGTIIAKDHPNAQIFVNGEKTGVGQSTGLYKRKRPLEVEVKDEGCESQKRIYDNKFRTGNFILSILSFGVIGLGVDLGTGASYKPDHKNNPAIEKKSDKNFTFTFDYSNCKNE